MRVAVLSALALAACVGSYSRAVEETRAALIGLRGTELRECLGVPLDVELIDGTELQTYRFEREHDTWRSAASGGGGVVIESRSPRGVSVGSGRQPGAFGMCELFFELRGGVVTQVRADGRDAQGMNAAGACMLEARRCLPYEDEAE